MLGKLRKNIRVFGGVAVSTIGLSIALAPAIAGVNAATTSGTNISQASIGNILPNIQFAYGVNPQTGAIDFGALVNKLLFPVVGGLIFIKAARIVLKSV